MNGFRTAFLSFRWLEMFEAESDAQGQGVTWAYRALAVLLRAAADPTAGPAPATAAAQEALHLAEETARTRYPHPRDFVRAYWLLGWAALAQGETAVVQRHLDEALHRCRAINAVNAEPQILLARARLAALLPSSSQGKGQGEGPPPNPSEARALEVAHEALRIATRSGYVLDQADIHNFLAQLALTRGDRAAARSHAAQARDLAFCDGPPYTYHAALQTAERLLAQLD